MFSISDVIITPCDMSCTCMILFNALCNIIIIDGNVYISESSLPGIHCVTLLSAKMLTKGVLTKGILSELKGKLRQLSICEEAQSQVL